jgi:hypothetical protein
MYLHLANKFLYVKKEPHAKTITVQLLQGKANLGVAIDSKAYTVPNKNNKDSNISVRMIHCDLKCREISASRVSGRTCELHQNFPVGE